MANMALTPLMEKNAIGHLEQVAAAHPTLAADCKTLEELFSKKYWHEVTEFLFEIVRKPEWDNADLLLALYRSFISVFQLKMNLFSLSQVVLHITGKVVDNAAAVAVLEEVAAVVKKEGSVDAFQLLRAEAAIRLVNVSRVSGKDEGKTAAKEIVEELVKFLKEREASTVHTDLRAQIYLAQAAVAKLEGSHDIFYEKCLLYIAHTQTSLLPHARQQEVAFDLGIAALLGKAVHNFGELIHHPIFAALDGSNHAWLAELLRYFNVGDIEGYEKVVAANGDNLKSFVGPEKEPFLRQKVQLMALLYQLFVTPVHDRTLQFDAITDKCKLKSVDDVEPLLLRALALNLIRGTIDEVAQTVQVTWIVSRALGKEEVAGLASHMKAWIKQVQTVHTDTVATLSRHEQEA